MRPYLRTDAATLYHARAEEVYPHLAPGATVNLWSTAAGRALVEGA